MQSYITLSTYMLDLLNLMGTKTVTYKIRRTTKKQIFLYIILQKLTFQYLFGIDI